MGWGHVSTGSTINPKLILFVFLPALLFESSFVMEIHQIMVRLDLLTID